MGVLQISKVDSHSPVFLRRLVKSQPSSYHHHHLLLLLFLLLVVFDHEILRIHRTTGQHFLGPLAAS